MDTESVKNVLVLGRAFNHISFAYVFEYLDSGVAEGLIEYTKHDIDKNIPDLYKYDGYVFLGCVPKGTGNKPYVRFKLGENETNVAKELDIFAEKLLATNTVEVEDKSYDSFNGAVISFNDQEFRLTKHDACELKEILNICQNFNFTVKEIIINEN